MNLVGNQKNLKIIDQSIKKAKLSHAYLFVGPKCVGKTEFGNYLAKRLLCDANEPPCGKCTSCHLVKIGKHPDFLVNDQNDPVGIDEIRGLIHFLEMKPYQSRRKIALISHFERLSNQAANAFLKSLEEPAANTVLIITAENIRNLLPTVVSRSQILRFGAISKKEIVDYLIEYKKVDRNKAESIYRLAGGRIGQALTLCDDNERAEDILKLTEDFNRVINSGKYRDRISFAENLTKDKSKLSDYLDYLEVGVAYHLKEKTELLKNCEILDKIAKSKDYLRSNANPRLIGEFLVL